MDKPSQSDRQRIRNYFFWIYYFFLSISIWITFIQLNCFSKMFRCFSDWRNKSFGHSKNFSLSTLVSVVFLVRKWAALTATKLYHVNQCKIRVALRTDHLIWKICLRSSNKIHIGRYAYYAESTLNFWCK